MSDERKAEQTVSEARAEAAAMLDRARAEATKLTEDPKA